MSCGRGGRRRRTRCGPAAAVFFAAAALNVAYGTVDSVAEQLTQMPLRLFHGDADTTVPIECSHAVHAALIKRGSTRATMHVLPGVEHDSWDAAYGDSDLAEWFRAQLEDGNGV